MSLDATTGKEELLKVHIINPNTGDLDDTRGNFVIGLVGLRKEKDNAATFTVIQNGEMTGVDILMTVRALKEAIIPALIDSLGMTEEQVSSFLENLKGEPDGNS